MGDEPNPMKPASPEQVVFAEALQRATPEARAAYLDAACGSDAVLCWRVEALLRAAENAGDFLEQPPTGLSGDADSTSLVSELSGGGIIGVVPTAYLFCYDRVMLPRLLVLQVPPNE